MHSLPTELLHKIVLKAGNNAANFRKICQRFTTLEVKIKGKTVYYYCGIFSLKQVGVASTPYLTHLTFGDKFNQNVDTLPVTLKWLMFGNSFNQSVDNLPTALIGLTFGHNFNQKVDKLPAALRRLTFGMYLKIDNLPASLTDLTLGWVFNQSVGLLLIGLKKLEFGLAFNH